MGTEDEGTQAPTAKLGKTISLESGKMKNIKTQRLISFVVTQ